MSKEEKVIGFYVICNKLKSLIRSAWKIWNVSKERLETDAEHVYSVQMLAIAMWSEYEYDIDLTRVLNMLAIHELGESVIGDITMFEKNAKDKETIEHEAVHQLLSGLLSGEEIEELFLEFDSHSTKEALFAFQCDKLECDLQAVLYDEEGYVDLNNQEVNIAKNDPYVKELLDSGESFKNMWIKFSLSKYPYDENFKKIEEYALTHKLTDRR